MRSRLNEGRRTLADALLATADHAHDDVTARTAQRRREAEETFAAARRGEFGRVLVSGGRIVVV